MATYRIPVLPHKPKARSKGHIAYGWDGSKPCGAAPGAKVVTVEAKSHAEAYRLLCRAWLPNDARPIMGKWAIKHCREEVGSNPGLEQAAARAEGRQP